MSRTPGIVPVKVDADEFILAFRQITANMKAIGKEMERLTKQNRLNRRDWIRATRRPALIHNGRKPR